uniref:Uncharacterized protein n=1 Tax=Magnetococcus massalia (strain MO-1) TaxID=451514 RepID=A0A1S7LJ18_MAGMO|nr:protein of unknown function [Candidatus Magnetococcus massalia]
MNINHPPPAAMATASREKNQERLLLAEIAPDASAFMVSLFCFLERFLPIGLTPDIFHLCNRLSGCDHPL